MQPRQRPCWYWQAVRPIRTRTAEPAPRPHPGDRPRAKAADPITIVEGQDALNEALENIISDWNAEHPDEKVTLKPLAKEANAQVDDITQRMQAKSDEYDLIGVDVVNTAQFAANGWLLPLEGDLAIDESGLLPSTVASGTYNGKLYAAPKNTNAAFLYYRKDLVEKAPTTWAELKENCPKAVEAGISCYIGQFKNYEGLTVNTTEITNAFDGPWVGPDGLTPAIDDKTKAGVQSIVDNFADNTIPQEALTYSEGESQTAFGDGKALFMRTWSGFSVDGEKTSVAGKYGYTVLPGVDGPGASTVGGYNVGISAYSTHPPRLVTSSSSCRPRSRRRTSPRSAAHPSSRLSTTIRQCSLSSRTSRP